MCAPDYVWLKRLQKERLTRATDRRDSLKKLIKETQTEKTDRRGRSPKRIEWSSGIDTSQDTPSMLLIFFSFLNFAVSSDRVAQIAFTILIAACSWGRIDVGSIGRS